MPRYKVTFSIVGTASVEVHADDEMEAVMRAKGFVQARCAGENAEREEHVASLQWNEEPVDGEADIEELEA